MVKKSKERITAQTLNKTSYCLDEPANVVDNNTEDKCTVFQRRTLEQKSIDTYKNRRKRQRHKS
ncbi:hypothetical protein MHBO_004417 [Bonamia ostreae]|uniref:Uncharacterized protein n=1 Tax=Bonamia ostreae TaxID=126728 RepID=A0ABV2AT91_9EUKA